jgi:hypothetical protein
MSFPSAVRYYQNGRDALEHLYQRDLWGAPGGEEATFGAESLEKMDFLFEPWGQDHGRYHQALH